MRALEKCRCGQFTNRPCSADASQEDMLCDHCRVGCVLLIVGNTDMGHVKLEMGVIEWPTDGKSSR